jgi:hypothetical protein
VKVYSYNKHRNKWTPCKYDHIHQSMKEANRCNELHLLQKGNVITELKTQVSFDLKVNDKLICRHILDFTYCENGKFIVEDSKGQKTKDWIIKHKLFEAAYPDIEYRVT